jgi:hypothetical protein
MRSLQQLKDPAAGNRDDVHRSQRRAPVAFMRSALFRLWILISIPWLFWLPYLVRSPHLEDYVAPAIAPPAILSLSLAWTWKRFGEARWMGLPEHLRIGLLRLYLSVTLPWVAWFSYRIFDELRRHRYSPWLYISGAVWSLLAVPFGGPILLFVVLWVVAGFRKAAPNGNDALSSKAKEAPPQSATDPKSNAPTKSPDHRGTGKALAKLLMDPDDCWCHVCMLREYKAPGPVATCEMAFARAAIIRDTISRCQPDMIASEMLAGVDRYVTEAFASDDTGDIMTYYNNRRLAVVAPPAIYFL